MRLCTGPMFALDGGEARWAAGTEVAAEDWKDVHAYRDRNGQSYDAADVLGAGGVQAEGERRRWSGFAEALLPVRHNWDVALAGRHGGHDGCRYDVFPPGGEQHPSTRRRDASGLLGQRFQTAEPVPASSAQLERLPLGLRSDDSHGAFERVPG